MSEGAPPKRPPGRPPGSRTARTAVIPVQRCTPEERARWDTLRPKIERLGISGVLQAIERAKDPGADASSAT